MKLLYAPTSPYARKCLVVAHELGLIDSLETEIADVWNPDSDIGSHNPLGKIPTLLTDEGLVLIESPVICEYLDSKAEGASVYHPSGTARWADLNLAALASGMMDATILTVIEGRVRAEDMRSEGWLERQRGKVKRALAWLEPEAGSLGSPEAKPTMGTIALGCALGYLDLRLGDIGWRERAPTLGEWYAELAKRPSMRATEPPTG